jgi:hypothetical protein
MVDSTGEHPVAVRQLPNENSVLAVAGDVRRVRINSPDGGPRGSSCMSELASESSSTVRLTRASEAAA